MILDIVNNGTENIILKPKEMLGIVDSRSLGYYKIKQGILQQNLSKYYRFERADILQEYFNKLINTLKKEREQKEPEDNYPWLDPSNEKIHERSRNIGQIYRFRKVMPDSERKETGNGNVI